MGSTAHERTFPFNLHGSDQIILTTLILWHCPRLCFELFS